MFGHSLNVTDVARASVSVLIRRRKDRRKGRCWVCRAILNCFCPAPCARNVSSLVWILMRMCVSPFLLFWLQAQDEMLERMLPCSCPLIRWETATVGARGKDERRRVMWLRYRPEHDAKGSHGPAMLSHHHHCVCRYAAKFVFISIDSSELVPSSLAVSQLRRRSRPWCFCCRACCRVCQWRDRSHHFLTRTSCCLTIGQVFQDLRYSSSPLWLSCRGKFARLSWTQRLQRLRVLDRVRTPG